MEKHYSLLLSAIIIISLPDICKAQTGPPILWQQCYGGSFDEQPSDIISTHDVGYIVLGCSASDNGDLSGNNGYQDAWLMKLDSLFNIEWQHNYGGSQNEFGNKVHQLPEGKYIFASVTYSNDGDISYTHGGTDIWLTKTDQSGIMEWEKSLGGSEDDFVSGFLLLNDGSYLLSGTTYSNDGDVSNNHGLSDLWIAKLDSSGNVIWQKCYGGTDYDGGSNALYQSTSGNFIACGYTNSSDGDVSGNHGEQDAWIVTIDSAGNLLSQHCYGGSEGDNLRYVLETDSGYLFTGIAHSNDGDVSGNHGLDDYWVVETDHSGSLLNQYCFGGSGGENAGEMLKLPGGGYCIVGTSRSNDGDVAGHHNPVKTDIWLVRLDSLFQLKWTRCYGSFKDDAAFRMTLLEDGRLLIAGYTDNNNPDGDVTCNLHHYYDYWFFIIDPECSDSVIAQFDFQQNDLTITCTDQSLNAGFWFWNFGDGTYSSVQNPSHTYGQSGTYELCLISGDGCSQDTMCQVITIIATSSPSWSIDDLQLTIAPNPFSELSQIQFSPDKDLELKIDLYDLQGRKIKTIGQGNFSVGSHQLLLEKENLNAGMYFLKIEVRECEGSAQQQHLTKKVIIE